MAVVSTCILQSLLLSGKLTTIASNIGTNIIISTIKATTTSISNVIKYITSESTGTNDHIIKFLKDSDLYFTVTTIQEFINEQVITDHKSVTNALHGVSDILTIINDDFQSIKDEFEKHKKGYFSSYRTFTWSKNVNVLETHNNILKHRYDILFELLKIYNCKHQ